MKISDLAKQLNLPPTELRKKITKLGYELGKKSRTLKDETALVILDKIKKEQEQEQIVAQEEADKESLAESKEVVEPQIQTVQLPKVILVRDLAAKINTPVTEVIKILIKNGIMANMNENIDYETAAIIASDFDYQAEPQKDESIKDIIAKEEKKENLKPRPPVVAIMGHVDHGKTTLLDRIRESDIAGGESGGITQHIGAYQMEIKIGKDPKPRTITFLDTPGHKAFVAMREHGAKITDIAVLVVAANDGVKPQTIEAVDHAKAAGVPIIVAINKIDDPGANIDRTKKELSEIGLASEEWGGSTIMVPISAKKGEGIDELLESMFLEAEMHQLQADPIGLARGVVIESHLDPKIGAVVTILVQKGTLNLGDLIWSGDYTGRVKMMTDEHNQKIKQAKPADPARVVGLSGVPNFGALVEEVRSEKEARDKIAGNLREDSIKSMVKPASLAEASQSIREGIAKELKIVLKADVAGSLEAIRNSLANLGDVQVKVALVHQGVGNITDSDVMTAKALGALIIGFRVDATVSAKSMAKQEKISIQHYDVIYKLIDEIFAALSGLLEPEIVEVEAGKAKVLKIFTHGKKLKIIGMRINSGDFSKGNRVEIFRDGKLVGESEISTIQKGTETVNSVREGDECGIAIAGRFEVLEDDQFIAYKNEEKVRKIGDLDKK